MHRDHIEEDGLKGQRGGRKMLTIHGRRLCSRKRGRSVASSDLWVLI